MGLDTLQAMRGESIPNPRELDTMKIVFLQDDGINESLALTESSACLQRAGHHTHLLIERNERHFLRKLVDERPGAVVIPADIGGEGWALDACERARDATGLEPVLCGTAATFRPDALLEDGRARVLVRGEAEGAFLDLAESGIGRGGVQALQEIDNFSIRTPEGEILHNPMRPLFKDLDLLPLPDRNIYFRYGYLNALTMKRVSSGRGCANHCSYCFNEGFVQLYNGRGTYVRRKSVDRVIEEVLALGRNHPLSRVHFADDLFVHHRAWLEEFSDRFRKDAGYAFSVNVSPERVDNEVARLLAEAGCVGVALGLESGVEQRREKILARRVTDKHIIEAAEAIRSRGMMLVTFNFLASPGETIEDAFATVRMNRVIRSDFQRLSVGDPIPGTPLSDRAAREQLIERPRVEIRKGSFVPAFRVDDPRAFANLFELFRLATRGERWERVVRRLLRLPPNPLFRLFRILMPLGERRFFGLGWIESLRFGLCSAGPMRRTKLYNNYIP